ncbi:hypothetical protein PR048_030318 [Dryococelus australis]|uniref:Uncharacterized protein n=1 Tax=Dryococelus australis TaxID=614101 RepID=A0ABQ9G8M6_9NEOP|nr:hypothetical protein PR048_030318 [Dryococelus australis]
MGGEQANRSATVAPSVACVRLVYVSCTHVIPIVHLANTPSPTPRPCVRPPWSFMFFMRYSSMFMSVQVPHKNLVDRQIVKKARMHSPLPRPELAAQTFWLEPPLADPVTCRRLHPWLTPWLPSHFSPHPTLRRYHSNETTALNKTGISSSEEHSHQSRARRHLDSAARQNVTRRSSWSTQKIYDGRCRRLFRRGDMCLSEPRWENVGREQRSIFFFLCDITRQAAVTLREDLQELSTKALLILHLRLVSRVIIAVVATVNEKHSFDTIFIRLFLAELPSVPTTDATRFVTKCSVACLLLVIGEKRNAEVRRSMKKGRGGEEGIIESITLPELTVVLTGNGTLPSRPTPGAHFCQLTNRA